MNNNETPSNSTSVDMPENESPSNGTPVDNDAVEAPTGDIITDVATPNLTMRTLKSLVDRYGEDLTWSTFDTYYSEETGSGLYILRYPIDADYCLLIGGVSVDEPPLYIRLVSEYDTDNYIDIRTESIDDFISNNE